MTWLRRLLGALGLGPRLLDYDKEKELARHKDARVRARLAARAQVRPEILYFLADDPAPEVRRRIAAHELTPPHADLVLARDADEDVRCDLAQKVARLAPELSADEQDRVSKIAYEVLEILARDQLTKVRRILAETLKDVVHAPPEIVRKLAADTELEVAGPVLRHSPVLSDDDLLEIMRGCPVDGALTAISKRRHVAARVSDAIVAADDVDAIGALLANPSAQIREETLDRIIDRAPDVEAWHGPLVQRPHLSPCAVGRVARFVADSLLEVLETRGDIDHEAAQTVKKEMRRRLDDETRTAEISASGKTPIERAQHMHAAGKLDEKAVAEALSAHDTAFVTAALAVLADQPPGLIDKAVDSRSAKGVAALCWKAGLSMRFATKLQLRFARIAPSAVLNPRNDGSYPLAPEDMEWQIEFFGSMLHESAAAPSPPAAPGASAGKVGHTA